LRVAWKLPNLREREIDDISDRRNKNEETFFKKPGQIRVRLFVKTAGGDLGYFRFRSRPES